MSVSGAGQSPHEQSLTPALQPASLQEHSLQAQGRPAKIHSLFRAPDRPCHTTEHPDRLPDAPKTPSIRIPFRTLVPGPAPDRRSTATKIRVQTFPLSTGRFDFCDRTLCRSAASRRYEKGEPHTRFPFSIRRDGQKPVGAFFSTCRPCRHPCRAQQEPQAQAWAVQQWRIRWSAGERPRKRHAAERSGKPA